MKILSDHRPQFRIAVPTHGRPEQLARFLEAVAPQFDRHPEFNLVVVNDGSHDEAYEKIVTSYLNIITYIAEPECRGIGPTRYRAISGATEEYIVTTDDDCIPGPFWLDWIKAYAMAFPNADILAGFTNPVRRDGTPANWPWTALPTASPASAIVDGSLLTAVGANSVFRRTFYESASLLDQLLWPDAEDYHRTRTALKSGASYQVCVSLKTSHPTFGGPMALIRKQYKYGLEASGYAVAFQDPQLLGPESLRRIWQAAISAARAVRPPSNQILSRLMNYELRFYAFLSQLALDMGRWRGLKRFSRKFDKPVPARKQLTDHYAEFVLDVDFK